MRLWFLSPSKNPDPNDPAITAGIYTQIAVEIAFILSNTTCLKPFLRPFHSGYFVTTVGNKSSGYASTKDGGSRGDAYYMISATRSAREGKPGPQVSEVAQDQPVEGQMDGERSGKVLAFRPGQWSHRATVLSDHSDNVAPMETDGADDMIISKTQAWTVSYEDQRQQEHQTGSE